SCATSGNVVQISGLGTCTVTAAQTGDGVYASATSVVQSFFVSKADQLITFGPSPVGASAGQPLVIISATSTSPFGPPSTIPVTFSSLTPGICTIGSGPNSALVTLIAAGVCTIAADQNGNA